MNPHSYTVNFPDAESFFPTKQNLPLNKESRVTLLDHSNERIEKIIGTIFTLHLLCGFKLLSQFQIASKYFKFLFTQNNLLKLLIHFFQQTLPKEFSDYAQRRKATVSKHQAVGYFKIKTSPFTQVPKHFAFTCSHLSCWNNLIMLTLSGKMVFL